MSVNLQKTEFVISAASPESFRRDRLPQVAFAGRSNVGKSSAINRLLNRKNMAYVGTSPGKTIHINYFLVDSVFYLVDLPGYGYAKVSKSEKERWSKLMEAYFKRPDSLALGVLIVDARHKPTEADCVMAQWFRDTGKPMIVAANKVDKLKKSEIAVSIQMIKDTLGLDEKTDVISFSAEKGTGRNELLSAIFSGIGLT